MLTVNWKNRPRYTYGDTKEWQKDTLKYLVECKTWFEAFDPKLTRLFEKLDDLVHKEKDFKALEDFIETAKKDVLGEP